MGLFSCICAPCIACFKVTKWCCTLPFQCCIAIFSFCCKDDGDNGSSVKLATIFPPLGVYHDHGFGTKFCNCLLLTIIGYLPATFYAIYVFRPHKSDQVHIWIFSLLTTFGYLPGLFYFISVHKS